jgi:general secretion pathway protein K
VRRREAGIAALTAILVVAVAASAAAMMLSQQSAMLDQTMLVASRAQAEQYAAAGLDWARGVLAQDARETDSLDDGWAKPIVGLPVERAVVAGAIADEQGKLNLNNLLKGSSRSEPDVQAFRRLLIALDLAPDLSEPLAEWLLPNGSDAPYLSLPRPYRAGKVALSQVDELYRVRGFDAQVIERLRPHVSALPDRTKLNVNTASERVLAAVLNGAPDKVAALVAARAKKPFANAQAFEQAARELNLEPPPDTFDTKSLWFSVLVRVQQDDVLLGSEALVRRGDAREGGGITVAWKRPRY